MARIPPFPEFPAPPPWSPTIDEQVELAKALYEGLLPDWVRFEMGKALAWILEHHPAAISLMKLLSPSLIVEAPPVEDPRARLKRGYDAVHTFRQVQAGLRNGKIAGAPPFMLPDTCSAALVAFLAYAAMPQDRGVLAPPEVIRRVVLELDDAVMAGQLVGLLQAVEEKPRLLVQWDDVGRELRERLPRLQEVRRGAFARLGPSQRAFFDAYQRCGWDARRCASRLRIDLPALHRRSTMAFRALGIAFRIEITGEDEGLGEETFA
jgi:hypothetical protein